MSVVTKALIPMALIAGFVSCGRGQPEPLLPAAELAPRVAPKQAADKIATERCNTEERCNGFGLDKKFQTREHCVKSMRIDASKDVGGDDCRNGVGEMALKECLAEISTQDCSGLSASVEKVDTYMNCRGGALCLD